MYVSVLNVSCDHNLLSTDRNGARSAVGSASDSRARGPGYDTWPGHIFLIPLPLIQERQLSVTGESIGA